jgi:hypothetical protein
MNVLVIYHCLFYPLHSTFIGVWLGVAVFIFACIPFLVERVCWKSWWFTECRCYSLWHCPRPIGVWEGHPDLSWGGAPWARGKRWENVPCLVLTFLLFDLLALCGVVWVVYFCLSFSDLSALTFLLWDFYVCTCNILLFVLSIALCLYRCLTRTSGVYICVHVVVSIIALVFSVSYVVPNAFQ